MKKLHKVFAYEQWRGLPSFIFIFYNLILTHAHLAHFYFFLQLHPKLSHHDSCHRRVHLLNLSCVSFVLFHDYIKNFT